MEAAATHTGRRWRIDLCFDGTRYHGWQRQPNAISVQQVTEEALATILRHDISITGAGRTDTGVHALQLPAHFQSPTLLTPQDLQYKLNRLLPHDISCTQACHVADDWHARFSATARTYRYYVHIGKQPFLRHTSLQLPRPLRFEEMNKAAEHLLKVSDFASFGKSGSDVKTTLCTVSQAVWTSLGNDRWCFTITANRFLRNMVRAIVGTLCDVGRGKHSQEEFEEIIRSRRRTRAGESMPPWALFLEKVEYPDTPDSH